jgi:hypothetical protein
MRGAASNTSDDIAPEATHWRLALVLGVATGTGAMLVIPYALASTGAPRHPRRLPLGVVVVLSGTQSTVLATSSRGSGYTSERPLASMRRSCEHGLRGEGLWQRATGQWRRPSASWHRSRSSSWI